MPKVAHAIAEYLPRSATFVHTLVRFQTTYPRVVLAGRTTNLEAFPLEAPIVELAPPAPVAVRAARRAAARLRGTPTTYAARVAAEAGRQRCDLVHAHWADMGWTALTAKRRLGVPLVTTFYGYDLEIPTWGAAWRRRLRALLATGDAFCCEGPFMAERVIRMGAMRERVHVVPIGLDLERLPVRPRSRSGRLVVLQAARFEEKKGIDLSIRAFAAAREQLGDSELWLVGDGPLRPALERLARDLGVASAVRFAGMLSYDDYAAALARAHVGIHPSRVARDGNTEGGAPTVLLEMQASGMPVVATRHADIPSIVAAPGELAAEEDVPGLAAALVRIGRETPDEWLARARRGRERIEARHDARVVARQVEALYDGLLGRSR